MLSGVRTVKKKWRDLSAAKKLQYEATMPDEKGLSIFAQQTTQMATNQY